MKQHVTLARWSNLFHFLEKKHDLLGPRDTGRSTSMFHKNPKCMQKQETALSKVIAGAKKTETKRFGEWGDRIPDLPHAKRTLYQLS